MRSLLFEYGGVPVEAGPDVVFDLQQRGAGLKISLVVIAQGYYPFPETAVRALVERYRQDHGRDPERVLVTGAGIYAVGAKVAAGLS